MKFAFAAGIAALLLGQAAPAPRAELKSFTFSPPAHHLKLWLPPAYGADPKITRRYERLPTVLSPDVVTLRLSYETVKLPEKPALPVAADLMKVEPSLSNLKFTPEVSSWRGRPVPGVRYEGFIGGTLGVYGRMVWLPLEPGTVVLHLYSEPPWSATMNQDWDVILANIEGPVAELTLRERAPGRWLAAKILFALGLLIAVSGDVMILARITEAIGGPIFWVGLLFPPFSVGYAVLHLHECRRGLAVLTAGMAVIGAAVLFEI